MKEIRKVVLSNLGGLVYCREGNTDDADGLRPARIFAVAFATI